MQSVLATLLTLLGAAFFLVAAIGVFRLPDLLTRMHAATKAGAFGGTLMLAGCAVAFGDWGVAIKAALTVIFFYLTAPIAGHMLGRAGYRTGSPLAPQTHRDDLSKAEPPAREPGARPVRPAGVAHRPGVG